MAIVDNIYMYNNKFKKQIKLDICTQIKIIGESSLEKNISAKRLIISKSSREIHVFTKKFLIIE